MTKGAREPMRYEPVIGLEVHLQLSTATKAFCGCPTRFGSGPNTQTCPVCLGFPGILPVLNERAFRSAITVALALDCAIREYVKFDRKNYYYPDLPKNFQISQYDKPVAYDGRMTIAAGGAAKTIRIKRVHLEEDAGKLIHEAKGASSLVDYNRAGIPLLEIVTEPDLATPEEAYDYLLKLKSILEYLEVSDCDMEKGSLRCDANISVRPAGTAALGTKVELKNMNSFKGVRDALAYEAERQQEAAGAGEAIPQETRLWDADKVVTVPMRFKEEAHDYRYFPEPDLVPFTVSQALIDELRRGLPELPGARFDRMRKEYSLSDYDAGVLTADRKVADYFEACAKRYDRPKLLANWVMGELLNQMNARKAGILGLGVAPEDLVALLALVDSGAINITTAREVFAEMIGTKKKPQELVAARGVFQISDRAALAGVVDAVIGRNARSVEDYRSGKKNAFMHLVGQVMKETKGRANPELAQELLKERLDR